jgi:hypothetical protein
MSSSHEPFGNERQFEISTQGLTTEERCLTELFDAADVDMVGAYQPSSDFFIAMYNQPAPQDLRTSIHPHKIAANDSWFGLQTFPEGNEVVATVSVGFDSRLVNVRGLHNIDFVRTEHGLRAFDKDWDMEDGELVPKYVQALTESQLVALAADASHIAQVIIDTDAERLRLGTLVEEAGSDGLRRFHVGDILSVITGRLVSARGMEGRYDILGYMTNDSPYTAQLGRFADECKPYLHQQFDETLAGFYEPPEVAMADAPSKYRWLGEVGRTLGEPLLQVKPIAEEHHAAIDPMTELELDHDSEFMKKVRSIDPKHLKPEEQ